MKLQLLSFEKVIFEYSLLIILLLFVPLTSLGHYYEVRHFPILFNLNTLIISLFIVSFISYYKFLFKKNHIIVYIIILYAFSMILQNIILRVYNIEENYFVSGFILLLIVGIHDMDIKSIINLLKNYSIILIMYSFFLFFDNFMDSSILPIYEIRYVVLSETQDTFRWSFSVLFGQKNAAGATLSVLAMLLIYIYKYYKRNFLILSSIFGIIYILFITNSATGIIILIFFILIYMFIISNKYFKIVIFFLFFISSITVIMYNIDLLHERKYVSIMVKLERILEYILFIVENPEYLFFGNLGKYFYTESAFLDMIINFGISVPFLLLMSIIYFIFKSISQKDFLLAYIFFTIIILVIISIATFMPSNIILFLISIKLMNEFNRKKLYEKTLLT